MFKNFFERRRTAKLMAKHKPILALIQSGLAYDIKQDLFFENFPDLPPSMMKGRYKFGNVTIKAIASLSTQRQNTLSLVVRKNEAFVGTLVQLTEKDCFMVLPQTGSQKDEMDKLVVCLYEAHRINEAERSRSLIAA